MGTIRVLPIQVGVSIIYGIMFTVNNIIMFTVRPLQINSLFPVLDSGIFACGRAVHFHYFIIVLAAFQAIICLHGNWQNHKKLHKSILKLVLSFLSCKIAQT